MHNLLTALAFIAMFLAPAIAATRATRREEQASR